MAEDEQSAIDLVLLPKMSVAELREICNNLKLHVSGKKSVLVERISVELKKDLEYSNVKVDEIILYDDEDDDEIISSEKDDINSKIDKLITKKLEKSLTLSEDINEDDIESIDIQFNEEESNVFVAEIIVDEEVDNDVIISNPTKQKITKNILDTSPNVITIPSFKNLKLNKKILGAVFAVLLLVGGTVFFVLDNDNNFTPKELNYGDKMNFNVEEARITVMGDDMVKIFRDASGNVLEDACGELEISMTGIGYVSVSNEEKISTDTLGRSGFYTAEKKLDHKLDVDFEGKTWRDIDECGNLGWSMSGNSLDMTTTSWTELETKELKRTKTDLTFVDIENKITNLQSVTYGLDGFGDLSILLPILTLPMKPIELNSFFGDRLLSEGTKSTEDETWNSDWHWTVGSEFKSANHGLVRTINIYHSEIGKCFGHANIEIQVKENSPWPIRQEVDILIDKNTQNNDCNFLVSSAADSILPDGKLTIRLTMGEYMTVTGDTPIEWGKEYLKPDAFDDRPRSSDKKKWIDSMPDESEIRTFNLEDAKNCLINNHSNSEATIAIIDGGYIWQAYWKNSEDSPDFQWNISWVDPEDKSGWLLLNGINSEECTILNSGNNAQGEINWNKDSIPDTPTISLLENRILDSSRYPDLHDLISNSQNIWNYNTELGYRLSVSEESELLSIIPIDLIDGQVSMTATRQWSNLGKENTVSLGINAQTGEMLGWYYLQTQSE